MPNTFEKGTEMVATKICLNEHPLTIVELSIANKEEVKGIESEEEKHLDNTTSFPFTKKMVETLEKHNFCIRLVPLKVKILRVKVVQQVKEAPES